MMRFNVDDVSEWHEHVKKIIAAGNYKDLRVMELEDW